MQSPNCQFVRRLGADRRGNVAIIFALVLVPILGIVSLSIDYGRALKAKSLLNNAADAALQGNLVAAFLDRDEFQKRVRASMDANLPEDLRGIPFTLNINESARTVSLSTKTIVPTAIMALVGVDRMDVAITSTIKVPEPKAPSFNTGPAIAGRPAPADAVRAAEDLVREIGQGQGGRGGTGGGALPAMAPADIEAARDALKNNPDVQRMQAEIEARMRDAMAKIRR